MTHSDTRRAFRRAAALTVLALTLLALLLTPAAAAGGLTVEDNADLFTEIEETELAALGAGITDYMAAAVVTTASAPGGTLAYAEACAIRRYGNDPAVIFLIDMDNRQIYIYANGRAQKTISKADARAITDNIYKDASRGDYYACAAGALEQILARCQGARLSRPVKHITNALIAVLFGVLINYLIAAGSRVPRKARRTRGEVTASVSARRTILPGVSIAAPIVISSARHYKSSGSGGGGGGHGGGGGGGGHSGGGGGHSF